MNKIFLTSIASLALVFPAIANIDKDASTATCNSATIGATSGSAYMDTAWTANTINLDFYSDGEKISTGSCTYDGAIELPNDPEDKTGYTFGGWKVRVAAAQSGFDLSTWEYGTVPNWNAKYIQYIGNNGDNTMGTTTGLNNGEWRITFGNGTVKGEATCSTQRPTTLWYNNNNTFTSDHFSTTLTAGQYSTDNSSGMQYCWCKATGVDTLGNGSYTPVASSSWVFDVDDVNADDCANYCASNCVSRVRSSVVFRRALFGISE